MAEPGSGGDGLVTSQSPFAVAETVERLESALERSGNTLFARIDHAAGAAEVGLALRPTVLLIFGNPKGGTAFMQAVQPAGIDLPLKVLVYQDADARTQVAFSGAGCVVRRHGIEGLDAIAATLDERVLGLLRSALTSSVQ
jgi:uncharacterized protein (DUF302 family)